MSDQRALTPAEIVKIADILVGTCTISLDDAVQQATDGRVDEDELLIADNRAIDARVFNCESCNWWFWQTERAQDRDDWLCVECGETAPLSDDELGPVALLDEEHDDDDDATLLHALADDGNPHHD